MNCAVNQVRNASGAIWSAAGNTMYALSSVVLLVAVSRSNSIAVTGSFSFAYTFAQMLLFVGLFGVSALQMTDYEERHTFSDYFGLRVASIAGMLGLGIIAGVVSVGENGKAGFIILLTAYMGIQAIADLYQSRLIQMNQMRLYGQAQFFRMLLSSVAFVTAIALWRTPILAITAMIFLNAVTTIIWCIIKAKPFYPTLHLPSIEGIRRLARESWPLCLGLFLISFIVSCSKYCIDLQLDDEIQGYYNLIFLPSYVITLISQFVFLPMLKGYHTIISKGDKATVGRLIFRNIGALVGLTMVACAGIYFLGPLLLGMIYHTELSQFRVEMLVVMLGGGFFAMYQFYYYLLVLIKKQGILLRNLMIGTLLTIPLTYFGISRFGMMGACVAYAATMLLLVGIFAISFQREQKMHRLASDGA